MDELFAAIKGRDQATVERILAADPSSASAVDEHGVSALLTAVYHDNGAAAAALRATGMELNVYEASARSSTRSPRSPARTGPTASTRSVSRRSSVTRRWFGCSSRPAPTYPRRHAIGCG